MSAKPAADPEARRKPPSYASRLAEGVELWNEARRSAKYDDSIFIWIPKNAGTSVYEMLRPHGLVKLKTPRSVRLSFRDSGRVTFGHMGIGSLVDAGIVDKRFVDNAFKFAVVRDPYARAVSLHRYLLQIATLKNWHRPPPFGDFLKLLADGYYDRVGPYNQRGLSQCNPQVEWLRDAWPDKIYRVENLGELLSDIQERWRLSTAIIPHSNRSDDGGGFELTGEEKALIEKIYAEDFETFEYAKR